MYKLYLDTPLQKIIFSAKPMGTAPFWRTALLLFFLMFATMPSTQAQCTSPPGDPAVFGDNAWNVYVYDHSDLSLATTVYSGFYTAATLGFDTHSSWNQGSSPANGEGWTGCPVDSDAFTFVHKRKGFPCGTYTITMSGWDDAAVLYLDGVALWSCADMSCDGTIGDLILNEDSEIEVRVREDGGDTFASLSLIRNSNPGILSPSGSTTICANTQPGAITLSGHYGDIVKWQAASNADFTADLTDIPVTAAVLSPADMGALPATRYYRAVVQDGSCDPAYPDPVEITVPMPVTFTAGSWDGVPTGTTPVVIDDDMLLVDDLAACSCLVKTGRTLTVATEVTLTVATGVTVETGGNLVLEDSATLLQLDDAAVNSGSIRVKRNSQPMKTYDYTYWSSPVAGNTLYQLSPLTAADKYYSFDPIGNRWVSIANGAQDMEPGRGYIIRAPQGWAVDNASSGVYEGAFNGVPNNGTIAATIQKGAGTYNLIGNPYPSAINIDAFLTDPANAGILNGTVYLWSHNTAISATIPGNALYNYTADDYAKYNLTGGVRTASAAITGGSVPSGLIASGQGFFIEAAAGLANGTYTATFNNAMRIPGSNSGFYKAAHTAATPPPPPTEKSRLWINISNTQGAYNQTLLGYITNATNGNDPLFDGKPWAAGNVLSLYSVNGTDSYSIQGRALPFTASDVVPLGYQTTLAGNFTIALEDFDGLFQDQAVYLLDKLYSITQDLKAGPYTFDTAVGTFNDRFEIHYTNSTLAVNPAADATALAAYADHGQVTVKAGAELASITLYDLLGRELYRSGTLHGTEFTTPPLHLNHQAVVLKAAFENQSATYKKLLIE